MMVWPFRPKQEKRANLENPSVPLTGSNIWLPNWGGESSSGVLVNRETALKCAPVWASVNFISGSISSLPLHVFKTTGDDRVKDDSAVYSLLHDAPNPEMTSVQWRRCIMMDLLLNSGRHTSWIERTVSGRIKAIWPLNPDKVTVETQGPRRVYKYHPDNKSRGVQVFEASEVIDLVWSLNPDGLTARDPIATLKNVIGLYLAQESYAAKVFQNGGVPPLQAIGPTATVAGAKRASEDIIRQIFEDASNQNNILSLPIGFELKAVGFDPEKMQMVEGRLYQLNEIARIYNLPKVFLQDLTGGTYSNTEQQDLHFVKHSLTIWLELIEQELNLKLFSGGQKPKRIAEFDVAGLLRGDFKSRMEGHASAIQNGIRTPNEVRRIENLPAMPEGDNLMMQGATVPIGSQPVTLPVEQPVAPGGQTNDQSQ
jgi:HK97 family phage portal protein